MLILYTNLQFDCTDDFLYHAVYFVCSCQGLFASHKSFVSMFAFMQASFSFKRLHSCCDLCSKGLGSSDTDEHSINLRPCARVRVCVCCLCGCVCMCFIVNLPVRHAPFDSVLALMNVEPTGLNLMLLVILPLSVFFLSFTQNQTSGRHFFPIS